MSEDTKNPKEEKVEEHVEEHVEETPKETKEEPKEEKDRTTEQFEKLTESNKELKEERDKYKNLLDSLKPTRVPETIKYEEPINKAPQKKDFKNLEQEDIDEVFESMKDGEGYLDGNKLLDTLKSMDKRAKAAEKLAKQTRVHLEKMKVAEENKRETEIMKRVHEKYPQLDPENTEVKFDGEFFDAVRNELIGQMMEGEQDPLKAADKWASKFITQEEPEMKKEEKEAQEKKEEQKKEINATRPRSPSMTGYYADEEDEVLRKKIQRGKKGALGEYLKRKNL